MYLGQNLLTLLLRKSLRIQKRKRRKRKARKKRRKRKAKKKRRKRKSRRFQSLSLRS